jgi:anti-sigma factor RsiW
MNVRGVMRCPRENKEEADLLAFSTGTLEPAQAALIQEHVKTCSACSEFVLGQRAVWDALDAWEPPAITADFDRRLFQRLEQKAGWWDRWLVSFRAALIPITAAACLIVVAGLISLHSPRVAPAPQPRAAQVENLPPDQVVNAVDDLQMLGDFSRAARADGDEL